MKITKVETFALSAPLKTPHKISTATVGCMTATIVRITTDEGISGVGECIARSSPRAAKVIVDDIFTPLLLGRDPQDINRLWQDMYSYMRGRGHSRGFFIEAMAGVDIALWDIAGKLYNTPIYKLLGGCSRTVFDTYASSLLLGKSPDILARETEELLRRGFTAIKLKIGQKDLKKDEEAVRIVRETIGKEALLMLDANSCYDAASAIEAGELLGKYNIYWLEEPVPADDHDGYEKVSRKLNIRIAGGESEFTARDFNDLLKKNCIDIVQPDAARAGGISECRKIALLADVYNKSYAPHVGMSSAICSFASLHLAAAMPNHIAYEYMFIDNPLQKIFNFELPPPVDGKISVPERPGLGIEINEKAIVRYLV